MKEAINVGDECWIRVEDFEKKPHTLRRGSSCKIKILEIGLSNQEAWAEVIDEKQSAKYAKTQFHKINLSRVSKTLDGLKSLFEFKEGDLVSVSITNGWTDWQPKIMMGVVLKSKKIMSGKVSVSLEGMKNLTVRSDMCILINRPEN
jgi:hypothetical protein